ncbi:MAG: CAP domain-containing protein [Sphingomonadaceae bacterium]
MVRMVIFLSLLTSAAVAQAAPTKAAGATVEERLLSAHNAERARLGHAPLRWSVALSKDAAAWAATLAKTNSFDHAKQSDQGENLWMGSKGDYSPEEMVGLWIDERRLFKPGRFPAVSTTGQWADVGHYTQLIWRSTTMVGCAIASNAADDYLVCRYDPPGNWIGQDVLQPVAANQVTKPTRRKQRLP